MSAFFIAAAAWTGLAVQCFATYSVVHSPASTLWVLAAYFTILTNLLVAGVFTGIAAGSERFRAPRVTAGTMLAILLVGVVYGLLLHGLLELSGGSAVANVILHMVTPALVPLFWIAFERKGALTWRDPLLWAIYPLLYLGYALLRGAVTGRYAYPFLDVTALGWARTAVNAVVIAAGFLLSGCAVVWLDHRLGANRDADSGAGALP